MSEAKTVLIIEDDADIARFVLADLCEAGYDVRHAPDGMSGLMRIRETAPDLILLDLGLPDFDGAEVLARVRRGSDTPVIVLTARYAPEEKVRLLTLGADDYVVKPFDSRELLARIRVQLRAGDGHVLEVGPLKVDLGARRVSYEERPVRLSPTEFNLLMLLAQQPGKVYSRGEIEEGVWNGELPSASNVVDVHMANLRGKLREADAHAVIRTVRGVGYALRT